MEAIVWENDQDQAQPWDFASFYDKEASSRFDYESTYPSEPLDDIISDTQLQTEITQKSLDCLVDKEPRTAAHSQMRSLSEGNQTPRLKLPIPPSKPSLRKPRVQPSAEAIARRRRQNRASQLAFRERSKREVDVLRQELTECNEENEKMYVAMQGLLEQTENLKMAIKGALNDHKARTSRASSAKSGGEEVDTASRSSPEGNIAGQGSE